MPFPCEARYRATAFQTFNKDFRRFLSFICTAKRSVVELNSRGRLKCAECYKGRVNKLAVVRHSSRISTTSFSRLKIFKGKLKVQAESFLDHFLRFTTKAERRSEPELENPFIST